MTIFDEGIPRTLAALTATVSRPPYRGQLAEIRDLVRQLVALADGQPAPANMSATQAAAKWGYSRPTVKRWCALGLIPGTVQIGHQWAIPADASPPALPQGAAAHKSRRSRKLDDAVAERREQIKTSFTAPSAAQQADAADRARALAAEIDRLRKL